MNPPKFASLTPQLRRYLNTSHGCGPNSSTDTSREHQSPLVLGMLILKRPDAYFVVLLARLEVINRHTPGLAALGIPGLQARHALPNVSKHSEGLMLEICTHCLTLSRWAALRLQNRRPNTTTER